MSDELEIELYTGTTVKLTNATFNVEGKFEEIKDKISNDYPMLKSDDIDIYMNKRYLDIDFDKENINLLT